MHSSYADWVKSREGKGPRRRAAEVASATRPSSRITVEPRGIGAPSDGILTFNQMQRGNYPPSRRTPSEVGSVRSVRSVMTVEEQISDIEKKMDYLMAAQQKTQEQVEVTQRLLEELLSRTAPPSSNQETKPVKK